LASGVTLSQRAKMFFNKKNVKPPFDTTPMFGLGDQNDDSITLAETNV